MSVVKRCHVSEQPTQPEYVSLEDASKELGIGRTSLYYSTRALSIETKKFPLDRRTYISRVDLERIKAARKAAAEGSH
jgi:hypothetical protein